MRRGRVLNSKTEYSRFKLPRRTVDLEEWRKQRKESAEKEKATEAKQIVRRTEDENLLGQKSDSKRKQIHESEEGGGEKNEKEKTGKDSGVGRAPS